MSSLSENYLPIALTAFLGFLSGFAIMIYSKRKEIFEKTRDQSTSTIVNVGNIQEQMKEIKEMNQDLKNHIDRRIDKIEQSNREEFRRAFEKIDKTTTEAYNLTWRVAELEGRHRGGRGNGSGGSVI